MVFQFYRGYLEGVVSNHQYLRSTEMACNLLYIFASKRLRPRAISALVRCAQTEIRPGLLV